MSHTLDINALKIFKIKGFFFNPFCCFYLSVLLLANIWTCQVHNMVFIK